MDGSLVGFFEENVTMRRGLMLLTCMVAIGSLTAATVAGGSDCTGCKGCNKVKKAGEGFCCGKGTIFGLKVSNQAVYDLLAGTEGMAEKMKNSRCPSCREAFANNGSCEHCKVYVANGRVYKSWAAHVLASGKRTGPGESDGMGCGGCAQHSAGEGFCSHCDVGFVAHRAFRSKERYDKALDAYETVKDAVKDAKHCEKCATARLTDGKCEHCQVSFKYGKPVEG